MRRLAAVVAVSGLLLASCTSSSKPHSAQSGSPSSPPSGSETPCASPSIRSSQSPSIRNGGTHPPVPSSPVSPVGNRDSSYPVVAAAAPVVVFATFSTNFRPSGIHYDGLVARDLAAGTSRRLWIPTQPDGTRNLVQPPAFAISADGRYIAFATSDATYKASLSALFLADRIKGTTRRLVGRSSSLCSVEGFSPVSISADGNTIVFFGRPYATEGARADRDGCNPSGHVYVFHVSTGIREIASVGFGTTEMPMDYIKPFVISPDGKHVAFWTSEPCDNQGTTTEHLYARDLSTKQTTLVSGDIATCSGADVRSE